MPAIRDFSQAYTTSTSGTTILVPMPAYEQNDLLIALLTADTGTATWSATGWTERFRATNTAQLCVMYKIASSSESDVTFTASAAETYNGAIISIRDVNTTTPFNGTDGSKNSALAKDTFPTVTTNINNCLILYLSAKSAAGVPSAIEGPVTLLFGKDGSAHSDGCGWGFQATSGATPSNVGLSNMGAVAGKLATIAIAPPSGGATIIPTYCAADSSTYLTPLTGAAFNGDAATINTVTTDFGSTLNGKTLTIAGTTYSRADYGLNSYHAMTALTGVTTSGAYAGNVMRFATANKPNVSGKNVIFHGSPYLPVDIQTTDSVALTGAMGVAIGLCSNANVDYKWWHVSGAGTPWGVGRAPLVINTSNATGVIQSTGTLNAGSIYSIGLAVSGKNVVPDWVFGSAWALDTTVICGGNSSEPIRVEGVVEAAALGHERMSVIQQGASQMLVLQPLQFGNGGTNPTFLNLDGSAIEFPKQYDKIAKQVNYCSVDNIAGITYYAGATDTIIHTNAIISSVSRFHWQLHASTSTSATYNFSGLSVIGAGTIILNKAITLSQLTLNNYQTLDVSNANLTSCTILNPPTTNNSITVNSSTTLSSCSLNVSTLTAGNYWVSTATPNQFASCTFTGGGGHAIRITSPGTYALNGNIFNGFGAIGSTGAAIYNDSSGLVTLNISGGGSTPTYRNGTSATTVVNNAVTLTLTVKDENNNFVVGAGAAIYRESDMVQLMNEVTNGSGVATEAYNYSTDTPIIVRIRKSSVGTTRYVPVNTTGTITSTGFSLTVTLIQDIIAGLS